MEQSYSFLHRFRDIVLSVGLACLLGLAFRSVVHIIAPKPQFFSANAMYKDRNSSLEKIIRNKKTQLADLSLRADKYPQQSENLASQIKQLELEISKLEAKSSDIQEATTQNFEKMRKHHDNIASYLALPLGILLLITAFFALPLPIQIGAILGSLYIMLSSYTYFWLSIGEWFKLVSMLIAIALIVALILKIYKKN